MWKAYNEAGQQIKGVKQIKEQILEKIGITPDAGQAYAWAQCYREMTNAEHNERSFEHWQSQPEASHRASNTPVRAEQAASADAAALEVSAV